MCDYADQTPMREVNSVASICCVCSEGDGARDRIEILFKANILQQVCKLTSRRE